ncbi:MAG TPA: MBL fold metallo-hydrolase, partial [Opitutaceae bacterium]|nr:MBL fold metallo-hydrolase [Opitutaceae bacterium]
MFTIEMLPAAHGDCLWIAYGSVRNRRRILIDVGVAGTDRALRQRIADAGESCEIELFVVSHCDADHIEGAIGLLKRPPRGVTFKDVWFNGWRHLPAGPRRRLGGVQGEMLSTLLCDLGLPWNRAFAGGAAAIIDELPSCPLADGMKLTLLSPTLEELRRLRPKWQQECAKKSVVPGSVESGREALERHGRRLGE